MIATETVQYRRAKSRAALDESHDLSAHRFMRHAQGAEDVAAHAGGFEQQAEQEALASDVPVAEADGLFLGQAKRRLRGRGEGRFAHFLVAGGNARFEDLARLGEVEAEVL